jgi:hypothetical protein
MQQMQLRDRIQDLFRIELSWREFRDLDSVHSISSYLLQNHPEVINADRAFVAENNCAPEPPPVRLEELAYTLQVGREAMEERAAFVVQSFAELVSALEAIVDGATTSIPIYRGTVKPGRTNGAARSEESGESIQSMIEGRQFSKILESWVRGSRVDFQLLYQGRKTRRISLPGYPFAAERFWPESAEPLEDRLSAKTAADGKGLNGFNENRHEAILDRLIAGSISVAQAMKIVGDS